MNGAKKKKKEKEARHAFHTVAGIYEAIGEPRMGQLLLNDENRVVESFLSGDMSHPDIGPTLVTGPVRLEWVKPNGSYSRTHLVEAWRKDGNHELYCGITAAEEASVSKGHDKVCERCRAAYEASQEEEAQGKEIPA
jgi:hypothetical protein